MRSFNPQHSYAGLESDGDAKLVAGGNAFWSLPDRDIEKFGSDGLVSEFECDTDWRDCEMHPNGDEFVYLLAGEIAMLLETPSGVAETSLCAPAAVIVPRGLWHTARVVSSARMFDITRGGGSQQRRVNP
jgi:hypothetical protein